MCIYFVRFEEELRKVNRNVSLPYWDYSTDYYLTTPQESVMWTDCFLGNGDGDVTSGPFANWFGGFNIGIKRNIKEKDEQCPPRLISKDVISGIMKFCHFKVTFIELRSV